MSPVWWILISLSFWILGGIVTHAADENERLQRARHFWANECASCHGQDGHGYEGSEAPPAPAIAGLPETFFLQQMEKFRKGLRGKEPDKESVYFMHEEANVQDLDLIRELAEVVAAMKPRKRTPSQLGDAAKGKMLFQKLCAECHGADVSGDPGKQSPPLYLYQDWYVVAQIKKFQEGTRHADPLNAESIKMHGMAEQLTSEQDVKDIAAYVTGPRKGGGKRQ